MRARGVGAPLSGPELARVEPAELRDVFREGINPRVVYMEGLGLVRSAIARNAGVGRGRGPDASSFAGHLLQVKVGEASARRMLLVLTLASRLATGGPQAPVPAGSMSPRYDAPVDVHVHTAEVYDEALLLGVLSRGAEGAASTLADARVYDGPADPGAVWSAIVARVTRARGPAPFGLRGVRMEGAGMRKTVRDALNVFQERVAVGPTWRFVGGTSPGYVRIDKGTFMRRGRRRFVRYYLDMYALKDVLTGDFVPPYKMVLSEDELRSPSVLSERVERFVAELTDAGQM